MKKCLFKPLVLILTFITCFRAETYSHSIDTAEGRKVYNNAFTYIVIDSCWRTAQIYEMDNSTHYPVLPRCYRRGNFIIKHVKDDFYSFISNELPGKKCVENMNVLYKPNLSSSDVGEVITKFNLGEAINRYTILAKSIRTGSIYKIIYPEENEINLPLDKDGYDFSILPTNPDCISMAGITYGFSPTLKFLKLQEMSKDFFSSAGVVDISLPFFNDEIFDLWCISGEIVQINSQILNDKIVWHGKEFKPYESKPNMFHF